jgi:hypothetical protein
MSKELRPEEPREWIFTFGFGQPHANCFTRIVGTFASAREEMVRRYGRKWSMQYESEDEAGVKEWNLKEVK